MNDDELERSLQQTFAISDALPSPAADGARKLLRWRRPDSTTQMLLADGPALATRSSVESATTWASDDITLTVIPDPVSGRLTGFVEPFDSAVELHELEGPRTNIIVGPAGDFELSVQSGIARFAISAGTTSALTSWIRLG